MADEGQQDTPTKPKWLRRIVYAILGLALMVAIPVTISKTAGRSALRKQLQRLHDADEPLTFDEFVARLPALSDADNSALILEELERPLTSLWDNRAQLREVPLVGKAKIPPWSQPWPIDLLESVTAFVDEHESLLARLDEIHDMPRGRYALDLSTNPTDMLLPRLSYIRTGAKLESLAALRDVAASNPDIALARCVTLVNIDESLHDSPMLISALVSMAIGSLAIDTAERVLSFGEADSESLRAFQESFAGRQYLEVFRNGLRGERLFQIALLEYARQSANPQLLLAQGSPLVSPPPATSWVMRGLLELNTAKSIELQTDLIEAAESARDAIKAAKAYELAVARLPAQYYLSKAFLPSYGRACELSGMHIASIRCAQAALASERFRLDRGHWPAALSDLVPDYIDAVPVDPFDGQPLRYKLDADRILVYSISVNGVDDGGDVTQSPDACNRKPDVGFRLLNPERRGFKTIDQPSAVEDQVP